MRVENKMINYAWKAYGLFIVLFGLVGKLIGIWLGTPIIPSLIGIVITSLYIIGLYGFIYKKTLWRPHGWRFIFWLSVIGLALNIVQLIVSQIPTLILEIFFTTLAYLPLIYALFKYSDSNHVIWRESVLGKGVSLLTDLLETKTQLETTTIQTLNSGNIKTQVIVESVEDNYRVRICRKDNEGESKFSNLFYSLHEVVEFIEENTAVRIADFARLA